MKICVPTIDDRGPDGLPSAHFGASPFFTFFDLESGEWEAVRNRNDHHEHGVCRPLDAIRSRPVDAVLCRGLGRGASAGLRQLGIRVYLTREADIAGCLAAFEEGSLGEMTEDGLCQGHGGHAGHGTSHEHGSGQRRGHGQWGRSDLS